MKSINQPINQILNISINQSILLFSRGGAGGCGVPPGVAAGDEGEPGAGAAVHGQQTDQDAQHLSQVTISKSIN